VSTFSRSGIGSQAVLALAALLASHLPAQIQVPGAFVSEDLITTGLNTPMDVDWLPDGRMLIAERAGAVKVWTGAGAPAVVGTQGGVTTQGERGLLSIAVDPGFVANGYVYLWHTRSGNRIGLTRWTLVGDRANATSTNLTFTDERRVLDAPDGDQNHNGGAARFGPDGKLYVSMGDDLNRCLAQNPTWLVGKVVRLDVGTVPAGGSLTPPPESTLAPGDNPVAGSVVFALGLRNPFRMEIDPVTGALYVADVGENTFEEISECAGGGGQPQRNLGWPWREANGQGPGCGGSAPQGLVAPIVVEPQSGGWSSIVAGPRYRNLGGASDFGAGYEGNLFYVDYFTGNVRRYEQTGGAWGLAAAQPGQPSPSYWATGLTSIAALRQGPDGGLIAVQHTSPGAPSGGFVRRVRPLGPVPSVTLVAGDQQFAPAGTTFAQRLEFEVRDAAGNLAPGRTVALAVSGPGSVPSAMLTADGNGRVVTTVTADNSGGVGSAITVRASTPGGAPPGVEATLYRRNIHLQLLTFGQQFFVVLQIANGTLDPNPAIPFLVTLGSAADPGIPTIAGLVCPDPFAPTSLTVEDSLNVFGGYSLSPQGPAFGTPSVNRVYTLPAFPLPGLQWKLQAIGFDVTTGGYFVTDTEIVTI